MPGYFNNNLYQPQPPYYNQPFPMPNSNYAQPQNGNFYAYVNGIEGAKAYQLLPGKSVLLMDSENPIFYFKSSNETGQATIKTFRFEEVVETKKSDIAYATKEEVEELKDMIKNALSAKNQNKKIGANE